VSGNSARFGSLSRAVATLSSIDVSYAAIALS